VSYVSGYQYSVLNHTTKGATDNKYGIEGGTVVKVGSEYHLFTAEMAGDPENVNMKIGYWKSSDKMIWTREATLYTSTANQDGTDPRASLWGPMTYYENNQWYLVYVGYRSAPSNSSGWYVAYDGQVLLAVSTVAGIGGLGGPYKDIGVILAPDKNSQHWEGLQGTDSFFIYRAKSKYYGFYGSATTQYFDNRLKWQVGLAQASSITGPWTRLDSNPVNLTLSGTVENPIVYNFADGTYYAIFDFLSNEGAGFGFAYSLDGVQWDQGQLITVPGGCRTPLGLIEETNGMYTLFYTRWDSGYESLHVANMKVDYTPINLNIF